MFNSIAAKLILRMILVGVLVLIAGLLIILQISNSFKHSSAERLAFEKQSQLLNSVDLKVETTMAIAMGVASASSELGSLLVEDRAEDVVKHLKGITQIYQEKTGFRGLSFLAIDKQNQIFARTFVPFPDKAKGNRAPRDFSSVLSGRAAFMSQIDLSGAGLFITATVPVFKDGSSNEIVGAIDLRAGLGSVVRDGVKQGSYYAVVLNEAATERWKKAVENPKFGSYYLAHKSWFSESEGWFGNLDIDALVKQNFSIQKDKAITSRVLKTADGQEIGYQLVGIDMSHPDMIDATKGVSQSIGLMLVMFIVVIFLIIGFIWYSSRSIVVKPVQQVVETINEIARTGKLNTELKNNSQDEIGQMTRAFASLLEQISQALREANMTVGAIAQGDFSKSMQGSYLGDLDELKQGVNASASSVAFMMDELSKVMQALEQGKFDVTMDSRVAENFRKLVESSLHSIDKVVQEINSTMAAMQNGEFNHRVKAVASGSLLELKEHVNLSLDSLEVAIQEISSVMSAQAQGDLTKSIQGEYLGELNTLKQAINASGDQLNQLVTDAIRVSEQVTGAASEVAHGALDLSDRVQQQAASVEETSATMEQMNGAVQNTTGHAREAAEVAHKVQDQAEQGNQVMGNTIVAMSAIQDSSHRINEIVALIDGIAFQTNLLALNAAVEAARAGDHGRGFAVVAGEVRALAQRSADAARDITSLIGESVERIDEGTKLATESGEVLQSIMGSIGDMSEMIDQIAQASGEQAQGISQVNQAITQIDSGTQQNAALVEETSAAAESLSEQAEILRKDMSRFITRSGAGRGASPAPSLPASKPKAQAALVQKNTTGSQAGTKQSDEWQDF